MSEIGQIVSVSISANSTTPSRVGFGTPLLLSYHTKFAERYRSYTSIAGMVTDGFQTFDEAYRMAAAAFSQNPAPASVIVGRMPTAPAYTKQLTITTAVVGSVIKASVIAPATGVATDLSYTVPAAQTTTQVATAFAALIAGVSGVAAVSAVAVITVTPSVAGRPVHVYGLQNATIEETTGAAGYDTELGLLQIENDDWYFVLADSASPANVAAIATWVLPQKKLYFVATNSSGELAGTGTLGSSLLTNERVAILYAKNSHEYGGTRWVGAGAPQTPGSITWAFKTLLGLTPQTLTSTQRANLEADNINHYQTIAAVSITRPGKVTSGEFIDVRHGIDALEAAIKEDVFALLANSGKVPMTDAGLDLVGSTILAAMKRFEGTLDNPGLIAIDTSAVIMPLVSSISTADRAARRLTGVRFSGTLAGAIHYVSVVGTLSV